VTGVEVATLRADPWPHLLLDDFLPDAGLAASLEEIRSENYEFEIGQRKLGRIEFSILKSETLWRAIYSRRIVGLFARAFGVRVRLNKENLLQLRRMNDETPDFGVHSDFTADNDTIVSFLYLSEGWTPARGGRLRLHAANDASAVGAAIEPIRNRFIAFQTKAEHWHSVERVHGWERLSVMGLWNIEAALG
jgi:hypothetical protein